VPEESARRQRLQEETLAQLRRTIGRAFLLARHARGHHPHGLDFTHHMVLHPILKHHRSQKEIGDAVGVTSGRVTGLIDDLESQGVVRRARSPTDRRKMLITVTPRGHRLHNEIHRSMATSMGRVFEGLSDDDLEQLRSLLERIAGHHSPFGHRLPTKDPKSDLWVAPEGELLPPTVEELRRMRKRRT
jgi:DNA-binding MarR family transcriptional regulator